MHSENGYDNAIAFKEIRSRIQKRSLGKTILIDVNISVCHHQLRCLLLILIVVGVFMIVPILHLFSDLGLVWKFVHGFVESNVGIGLLVLIAVIVVVVAIVLYFADCVGNVASDKLYDHDADVVEGYPVAEEKYLD